MTGLIPASRFVTFRRFVIAWTVSCVLLGVLAAWLTLGLQQGADAIDGASRGLDTTATSLRDLDELPLVGDQVADAADAVERGADTARASGEDVRSSIRLLAILLGLAIALLPTIPLIALTLVLRPD